MAAIEAHYAERLGYVPETIRDRAAVAGAAGRLEGLEVLEALRRSFLQDNPLGPKVQRLVHFALTLAQGDDEVTRIHIDAAGAEGVTIAELYGVCETVAIVLGLPAYTRGVRMLRQHLDAQTGAAQ